MASQTYVGPQEQVFPHLRALDGESGTLVLRPGESYDFGGEENAGYKEPPGPAWWWKPAEAPAAAPAPAPVKTPPAPPAAVPAAAGAAENQEG